MLLAKRLWAYPGNMVRKWKALGPATTVALLCLLTAGTGQSVSAVSPIAGRSPMSGTGLLPAAMEPGLFGPPAPGAEPVLADPESSFLAVASGPILNPGAAARAFSFSGPKLARTRAMECLAMAVYYEAASEGVAGQAAVAQVVLNRVAHPAYPATVCDVVFQGSERVTGCQFSFTCDGSLARRPNKYAWLRALDIADKALSGIVYEPVGLATHYHTHAVSPYWAPSLTPIGALGEHRFYRWRGAAGTPAAFTTRYAGYERAADSFIARREVAPVDESLLTLALDQLAVGTVEAPLITEPVAAAPAAEPLVLPPAPSRIQADKQLGSLRAAPPAATPRLKADEAGSLKIDEAGPLKVGQ